jgi:hypothetical protein
MNVSVRANAGITLDPQRLKYLTENFTGLQGLIWVACGAAFLVQPMQDIYGSSWPIRGWWPILASLAGFIVLGHSIPRYYRRRFGWVEPRGPSNRQVVIFLLVFVVLLFWGRRLEMYANDLTQVIDSMVPNLNGQIELVALAGWIVALSTGFLNRSRNMVDPYWIYFLGVGTIACAVVAFCPFWYAEAAQSLLWRTLNAGSLGFSLMAWGLYDHITLVRMLPKKFAENDDE